MEDVIYAFDFFWQSWLVSERSVMPSGLPARYVIKFVLFASVVLLALQALALTLRNGIFLLHGRRG